MKHVIFKVVISALSPIDFSSKQIFSILANCDFFHSYIICSQVLNMNFRGLTSFNFTQYTRTKGSDSAVQ